MVTTLALAEQACAVCMCSVLCCVPCVCVPCVCAVCVVARALVPPRPNPQRAFHTHAHARTRAQNHAEELKRVCLEFVARNLQVRGGLFP